MLFNELWDAAHKAGLGAVQKVTPTPMVVTQHSNPLDDNSSVQKQWLVPDGPCGFAWVVIKPANSKFARWAKEMKLVSKHYGGGVSYWISLFNQSMQRKEAYAVAFAKVLQDNGINAYADSRMD